MDNHYQYFYIGDDASEEIVRQYIRGYVMRLLEVTLLSDTSSNKVKLIFLPLLEDLDFTRRLSWCSAVLACLYRIMCWGSAVNQSEIESYFILLQV